MTMPACSRIRIRSTEEDKKLGVPLVLDARPLIRHIDRLAEVTGRPASSLVSATVARRMQDWRSSHEAPAPAVDRALCEMGALWWEVYEPGTADARYFEGAADASPISQAVAA